ncbi:MAG: hypothetical protein MUD01_20290 [Chloroflexaceae bacterium]|jgi:hypothetical protein|nr:hypothetical protein [Chloroflexaceae bacterium]
MRQLVKHGLFPLVCFSSLALDVFYLGLPASGLLLALVGTPIYLVRAVVRFARRSTLQRPVAPMLLHAGLCLATLGTIIWSVRLQAQLADQRAQQVINVVEQFHTQAGRYPQTLEELVPTFLERVPPCCMRAGLNEFFYDAEAGRHTLWWIVSPPFGRKFYTFETKSFSLLD